MDIQLSNKRMLEYGLNELYSNIFSFSTTRHGGYSEGAYASFNCNDYCDDDIEKVEKNQDLLRVLLQQKVSVQKKGNESSAMDTADLGDATVSVKSEELVAELHSTTGIRCPELIIPHQVHKTEIGVIDESFLSLDKTNRKEYLEGIDAIVTSCKNICLCISTADCIPVLCYDTRNQVVAAIHAGWRGTVGRIVEKTLQLMVERYGTHAGDVHAVIGPGISLNSFEVGDEVYKSFSEAGFDMQLIARKYEKWHIDLWEANRLQLISQGVLAENIELSGICTYLNQEDFFSARRLGIHSGRILSGIMLVE